MKFLKVLFLFFFITCNIDASPLIPSKYFKHEGGLNSRYVETSLEEEQASDMQDVYIDRGAVIKRGGYALEDTYTSDVYGLYIYELTHTTAYSRSGREYFLKIEGGTVWCDDGTTEYKVYDNWTSDVLTQCRTLNNQCFIADDGTNDLLVYDEYAPLINRGETVQGWAAGTDGAGVALQATGENEGDGCIEWDKTGTTVAIGDIQFTLVTTQDWTNYSGGLLTLNLYDRGDIGTTVTFRYGSTSTNYYYVTNTASRTEDAWNVLDFNLSSADTTGTPDISTVKWMAIAVSVDAATSTFANCLIDAIELHCARPAGIDVSGTLTPTVSATAGNVDTGVHYYKVSYYSNSGASESNMSDVSSAVTCTAASHGQVNLSAIPCSDNPWVTKRKIWRTKAGGVSAGPYYLVTTINDNVTQTYADNIADSSLSTTEEGPYSGSEYNDNSIPPKGKYLVTHRNRLFIAGNQTYPSRLYYSEFNEPQSFPALNYYNINTDDNSKITGLAIFLNNPLIFKSSSIWAIKGSDRFDFELQRVNSSVGCVSGYTIIPVLNYVYFLGRRDVFRLGGSGIEIISDEIRDNLENLNDSIVEETAFAVNYNLRNQYLLSFPTSTDTTNSQTLVFDYDNECWTEYSFLPICATTANFNSQYQRLYFSDTDSKLYRFEYDSSGDRVLNDNASAITSYYVTKWYDLDSPYIDKEFPFLYLYVENETGVERMKVYWATDYDTDWTGPIIIDISQGGTINTLVKKIDLNDPSSGMCAQGRTIRFKFLADASNDDFTICGWVVFHRETGGVR